MRILRITTILLFTINLLIANESKANCPVTIVVNNIVDNRSTTSTIVVNFTVVNSGSLAIVTLVGLPATYTSSPSPISFGIGTNTGSFTITIPSSLIDDAFSFSLSGGCVVVVENIPPLCPTIGFSCGPTAQNVPSCISCRNSSVNFSIINPSANPIVSTQWNYGDGSPLSSLNTHTYTGIGVYSVTLTVVWLDGCTETVSHNITIEDCCVNCLGSFAPLPGAKYVLSAWVKEDLPNVAANVPQQVQNYIGPEIELIFPSVTLGGYTAKGNIIEGWQKIEEVFIIPAGATEIKIKLNNSSIDNDVYFDDIRISPFNSSMKSYVYDPVSLKLWAELDENNYATFYQYDEEGKLIRIKKETSRGVQTIQESREGSYKKEKIFNPILNQEDSSN